MPSLFRWTVATVEKSEWGVGNPDLSILVLICSVQEDLVIWSCHTIQRRVRASPREVVHASYLSSPNAITHNRITNERSAHKGKCSNTHQKHWEKQTKKKNSIPTSLGLDWCHDVYDKMRVVFNYGGTYMVPTSILLLHIDLFLQSAQVPPMALLHSQYYVGTIKAMQLVDLSSRITRSNLSSPIWTTLPYLCRLYS